MGVEINYYKNYLTDYLKLDDYMFIEKALFNKDLNVITSYQFLNNKLDYRICKTMYKSKYIWKLNKNQLKEFSNINDKKIIKKLINKNKLHIYHVINNKINDEDSILECFKYYIEKTGKYSLNTIFYRLIQKKYFKIINYIIEKNLIPKKNCYGYYFANNHYYDYFFKLVKINKLFINRNLILNICSNGIIEIFIYLINNDKIDPKYFNLLRYIVINNHQKCLEYLFSYENNKKYLNYLKNEALLVNLGKRINYECLIFLMENNFDFCNNFYLRLFDSEYYRDFKKRMKISDDLNNFIYNIINYGYNKNPNILSSNLLQRSLTCSHIKLVKFLLENNCPHNGNELYYSVISGNCELLKMMHIEYNYDLNDERSINYLKNLISRSYISKIERKEYKKCYDYIFENI